MMKMMGNFSKNADEAMFFLFLLEMVPCHTYAYSGQDLYVNSAQIIYE